MLWGKSFNCKNDQNSDPTTYITIVQPCCAGGLYLVVRTRYCGMTIRPITYIEACQIIGEEYLNDRE